MSFNKNQRQSIHGPRPCRAQHIVFNHHTLPTAKIERDHSPTSQLWEWLEAAPHSAQSPVALLLILQNHSACSSTGIFLQALKLPRSYFVQSLGTGCPLLECLAFPTPCTHLNLSAHLCQTPLAMTKLLLCA